MPLGFGADGILGTADDSTLPEGDFTEHTEYDSRGRMALYVTVLRCMNSGGKCLPTSVHAGLIPAADLA